MGFRLLGVLWILGILRRKFINLMPLIILLILDGDPGMKTLKISDDVHQKLTALLGELTAQTMKMQTYQDAINALLSQSVILPPELLREVEIFIEKNKHKGYTRKEEFIRQAIRFLLKWESEEYEYIELEKEKYDKLNEALKEMDAPFYNAEDFINKQVDEILEKYHEWLEARKSREK
jgi:Arc/MetJ-type ribon-helix-helix transcriptional regulator